MLRTRNLYTALEAMALATLVAVGSAGTAYAHITTEAANNGYGQEKHEKYGVDASGNVIQDTTNPGSDNGLGVPQGGPGAGQAGEDSKQDGTGLR